MQGAQQCMEPQREQSAVAPGSPSARFRRDLMYWSSMPWLSKGTDAVGTRRISTTGLGYGFICILHSSSFIPTDGDMAHLRCPARRCAIVWAIGARGVA